MGHHNPFYDITKADAHTPQNVAELFVPDASPIWTDLQYSINHLVVGARGTGKTMALRQLDFRTLTNASQTVDFVGAYIHVSRISTIFHTLFASREEIVDLTLVHQFQQVFADYLVLEIIRVLCDLSEINNQLARPDYNTALRLPSGFNTGDIADECVRLQMHVESSIQSWLISEKCTWHPLGDLPAIVVRIGQALRRANLWLARDKPCLYVLLDESSPIPQACQRVLNSLLLRGQPYCVKLAVRPFEWRTLNSESGPAKEQNTDVFVLQLDHSDELSKSYISYMEKVVNKVLNDRYLSATGIRELLPASPDYPYSGFDAICAASSGNPQDLLMMCSAIFATNSNTDSAADEPIKPVLSNIQHDVVKRWSSDFVYQNAYESSRRLCRSLASEVKRLPEADRSIAFEYQSDEPDLFLDESLPDDLAEPLRPAFAGGFVRAVQTMPPRFLAIPSRFQLSRGALPGLDIALDTPTIPALQLDRKFIETKSKVIHSFKSPRSTPDPIAYVSNTFIKTTDPQWGAIQHALMMAGFSFPKVRHAGPPLAWDLDARRRIIKSNIALIGARLTPSRAMFEIGLCAGATRPVNVIICQIDGSDALVEQSPGMSPLLPTVSLQTNDNNYSQFAAEVRSVANQLLAHPSDFASIALTGVSLRPKRKREKTVYLSLPDSISLEGIRERLMDRGWSVITENDMTSYTANALQVPVLCAFTSRVGVVNTSAEDGLNAFQYFKLGLFTGKRGWRVLHTSKTKSNISNPIDRTSGAEFFQWKEKEELVEHILHFIET